MPESRRRRPPVDRTEPDRSTNERRRRPNASKTNGSSAQAGAHEGRPKVNSLIEQRIRTARKEGIGILRIAREIGCGLSMVERVLATQP